MTDVYDQLTDLQRVILEVEHLGLPLRDAVRQVNQRVGFFVGQQRYIEEQQKAQRILTRSGGSAA